ncbi:hypothetical protein EDD18DRAFT_1356181 [Armillaria luteobubalina]|uniref:Uncharacterized protein n=1 Tax=Armillaria luteobubalina TaxID=153913 RepID=A0AA39Q1N6_9AGAR|nr:hypothetical protein EDD18DRAFT_1356181 [Armillaria luteobubalina]
MSTLQLQKTSKGSAGGYIAAKNSSLVWSLPVLCQQFLLTPLDPEKWFALCSLTSDQDTEILEFGIAIGRSLKLLADDGWSRGGPPKDNIDFFVPVHGSSKSASQLDILVLVKVMDIAAGFLRLPTRSHYPSFKTAIKLEANNMGYLKRLDDWPNKLDDLRIALQIDVCLLASHWKHESTKNWLKALSVLDGVSFHMRLLCYHNGVEEMSVWQRFITNKFPHPDIQRIMADDEMFKKLKQDLPRWKQAFVNAVAILPLVLILGKGMGRMLNTSQALRVGGRLSSLGKPELIQRVKEMLWRCIVCIAWGSWMSEIGLKRFLDDVASLVEENEEHEGRWFTQAIAFAQESPIPGLEVKVGIDINRWLMSMEDRWIQQPRSQVMQLAP